MRPHGPERQVAVLSIMRELSDEMNGPLSLGVPGRLDSTGARILSHPSF